MNFVKDCLKGIAIGAGAILPGISSGVLCVIFGIYEKLLDAILNFFKDMKKHLKFLMPLVIGGGIGIILSSNLLIYFFHTYPIHTNSIFIGLILGTIPILIKEVNQKEKFKKSNLLFLGIALFIGVMSVLGEKILPVHTIENLDFIYLMASGFFMSVGVVVPGVSSTIILMLLGVYSVYLQSVSNVYLPVLIPMAIGLLLGSFLFMKIIKWLLNQFYAPTFYSIIGFTLGSVFVLMPELSNGIEVLLSVFCVILGWQVAKLIVNI